MSDTHPLIAAALAAPKTHVVVTQFACGKVRTFETRSLNSAINHAFSERANMGRDLIDRVTGATVRKVSVVIGLTPIGIASADQDALACEYVRLIGYDPFADDPSITVDDVRAILIEYLAESA